MNRLPKWVLPALLILSGVNLLSACINLSPALRRESIERMATAAGWENIRIPAGKFVLAGFVPKNLLSAESLSIYIEGDGLAWLSRSRISPNPTPVHAIGLELAMHQSRGAAVYLGRPCQYVDGEDARNCNKTWWTDARFGKEIVESSNLAIDQIKKRFKAKKIVLIGYSGGGAIALLVAAKRKDVTHVITVAGNLDHRAWTQSHRASPLKYSLNPADYSQDLANIPQLHFIGGKDDNVGYAIARSYQSRFPENKKPELKIIESFDHVCCWVEKWSELYK